MVLNRNQNYFSQIYWKMCVVFDKYLAASKTCSDNSNRQHAQIMKQKC